MKLNLLQKCLLLSAGMMLMLASCERVDDNPDPAFNNLKGLFVVCEGTFGKADGDITYYNTDDGSTVKGLYHAVNQTDAGDVVQSFAIADTLGFIVVNNSQKLIVVNMKDFRHIKTITGFSYPRSIVRADETTIYLSNGNGISDNYIYSIDLVTLTKRDSLAVTTGPEALIKAGEKVYASLSGGWNNDGKTVLEIDPRTFSIAGSHEVALCPVDLAADGNGHIWAYCKGVADYSNYPEVSYTGMGLSRINLSAGRVTTMPFSTMAAPGTNNLSVSKDGKTLYFINDGVYAMASSATALPAEKLVGNSFYGIDTDPKSGDIVVLDADASKVLIFNTNGVKQFEFGTGSFPGSVVFSY